MRRIAFSWFMLIAVGAAGIEREPLEQYQARRHQLAAELDGAIVLFPAEQADLVEYRQENNFYYLTGFDEPGAILLIDATGDEPEEFFFLPPRDLEEERWTGVKLGPGPDAVKRTGFGTVEALEEFSSRLESVLENTDTVYTLIENETNLERLQKIAPRADYNDIASAIAALRLIKSQTELTLLEKGDPDHDEGA